MNKKWSELNKTMQAQLKKKDTYIVKALVDAGANVSDDDMIDAIKSKNSEIKSLVLKKYKVDEL